jgi:FkbM family methyltransferase
VQGVLDRIRLRLRRALIKTIRIRDAETTHVFHCESMVDVMRARTLFTKESGTVDWIRKFVREGQTFYDIGANMGIYTVLSAARVGAQGSVYSFEPHVVNVHTLLQNVKHNKIDKIACVLSCALNDREGYFTFNYYSDVSGSSNSQLNGTQDGAERPFQPVLSETKFATTIDALIAAGTIKPAHHIKIDVDGNELLIVRGMLGLLGSPRPPHSIQIEVNPRYKTELFELMDSFGYAVAIRHDTMDGKKQIQAGQDPNLVSYNAVFMQEATSK